MTLSFILTLGIPIAINLIVLIFFVARNQVAKRAKYKISVRGYKKIPNRKPKRKQWWVMILLLGDGLFILVLSLILYKDSPKIQEVAAVVEHAIPKNSSISLGSIMENMTTILGSISTLIGILLGIKELKEKKKESKED